MTNTPEQSQLGKASAYTDQYDPTLLFPIPRAGKRAEIGIADAPPFFGADLWTAFEVSWLNLRGKPQVALVHFTIPCESPNIVESKSFKLYLNSFNNTRFAEASEVQARLPAKPITYIVNTHHHFDHLGGLRTYVAEGATVVTALGKANFRCLGSDGSMALASCSDTLAAKA